MTSRSISRSSAANTEAAARRAQIQHLITMAQSRHVTVQMLPACPGEHVAVGGPLTILRFAEPEIPDIAHHTTTLYLDRDQDVQPYRARMDRLVTQILEVLGFFVVGFGSLLAHQGARF